MSQSQVTLLASLVMLSPHVDTEVGLLLGSILMVVGLAILVFEVKE